MVERYRVSTPTGRQHKRVARSDRRQFVLEGPRVLTKNRSLFTRVGVGKHGSDVRVVACGNTSHAILVVDIVECSRDIDCFIFAVTLRLAAGTNKPPAQLLYLAAICSVDDVSRRILATLTL